MLYAVLRSQKRSSMGYAFSQRSVSPFVESIARTKSTHIIALIIFLDNADGLLDISNGFQPICWLRPGEHDGAYCPEPAREFVYG